MKYLLLFFLLFPPFVWGVSNEIYRFPIGDIMDSGWIIGRISGVHKFQLQFQVGDLGSEEYRPVSYTYLLDAEGLAEIEKRDWTQPVLLRYERRAFIPFLTPKNFYQSREVFSLEENGSFEKTGIPFYFEETGSQPSQKKMGRLIQVQRWGWLYAGCTLTLHLPGQKIKNIFITRSNEEAPLHAIKFHLQSEDACLYAESILPFAPFIEVQFVESWINFFDSIPQVKSIQVCSHETN